MKPQVFVTALVIVAAIAWPACTPDDRAEHVNGPAGHASELGKATKFVTIGHIRDIRKPTLVQLADAINEEDPQFVFVLGDFTWDGAPEHWKILDAFFASLKSKVVGVPGNHEIWRHRNVGWRARDQYLSRFGQFESVEAPGARFLTITTNAPVETVKDKLREMLSAVPEGTMPILLMHHYIWDEFGTPRKSYDPPFLLDEIEPVIRGRVSHIFGGDNSREFRTAKRGEFTCYASGVNECSRRAPMGFMVSTVKDGQLEVRTRLLSLAADDPWLVAERDYLRPK